MLLTKFFTPLILMSYCISLSKGSPDKQKEIDCTITRKCSTIEDIVWATDSEQCYVFRNPCIYATEMCLRRSRNKKEYEIVTEKECKKYCKNFCTDEYVPVCAEYNNEYKMFPNECELYRESCQNNQSYIFLHVGKCDQAVEA